MASMPSVTLLILRNMAREEFLCQLCSSQLERLMLYCTEMLKILFLPHESLNSRPKIGLLSQRLRSFQFTTDTHTDQFWMVCAGKLPCLIAIIVPRDTGWQRWCPKDTCQDLFFHPSIKKYKLNGAGDVLSSPLLWPCGLLQISTLPSTLYNWPCSQSRVTGVLGMMFFVHDNVSKETWVALPIL